MMMMAVSQAASHFHIPHTLKILINNFYMENMCVKLLEQKRLISAPLSLHAVRWYGNVTTDYTFIENYDKIGCFQAFTQLFMWTIDSITHLFTFNYSSEQLKRMKTHAERHHKTWNVFSRIFATVWSDKKCWNHCVYHQSFVVLVRLFSDCSCTEWILEPVMLRRWCDR